MEKKNPTARSPGNILVPIDFSVASKSAFRHALGLARTDSRIILLHVIPPSAETHRDSSSLTDTARRSLHAFSKSTPFDHSCPLRFLVRIGTPFHEILATAKEHHAELIILAVHALAPFGGLALGHTVDRVTRYAPCPIMLVREADGDNARAGPRMARASTVRA